jgi:hypothetical protein
MTETKKRGRPRIEDIKEKEQKSDSQNSQIDELNDKIQELTANLSNIESKHVKSKNNKGAFNIRTPVYIIHYDGSFNRARAKITDNSIIVNRKKYMISSNPLRMTNIFGYSKLMYFISDKTGSTIDFSLLFANKAQFDARTHELWFDKTALQNALKIQKTNPTNAIAFIAIGMILGIFVTGSGLLGV